MQTLTFSNLKLIDPILKAVQSQSYTEPTPIQVKAIPHLLEGRDLLGCAQTGTGKTAAFALPILQRLVESGKVPRTHEVRALILTPTRELALQILESFQVYGKNLRLSSAAVFGGVGQNPQVRALNRGLDIMVATPGRLLDLYNQKFINFKNLEIFVLDEADRMLDMGFIRDIKKILTFLPARRQNLFFSATMAPEVDRLATSMLRNPVKVEVTPSATTVEKINQSVMFVDRMKKQDLLDFILKDEALYRVLIFTKTKHAANRVVLKLARVKVHAEAIHGNKSQSARVRALENFKAGRIRVLVATDIAARGIDVEGISHVINFELPNVSESYVHRIGRTARAGEGGFAISFCDREERAYLKEIEKLIRLKIPVISDHPFSDEKRSHNSSDPIKTQHVSHPPKPQVKAQVHKDQHHHGRRN